MGNSKSQPLESAKTTSTEWEKAVLESQPEDEANERSSKSESDDSESEPEDEANDTSSSSESSESAVPESQLEEETCQSVVPETRLESTGDLLPSAILKYLFDEKGAKDEKVIKILDHSLT